ncbi:MAG: hypothetical protein HQ538_02570 [Parcubacteria group bacterium]|nr:hypothetical protein [Parcubacteria group bacterium]
MSFRVPFTTNYISRCDLVKKEAVLKKLDEVVEVSKGSYTISYAFKGSGNDIWYIQGIYADSARLSRYVETELNEWAEDKFTVGEKYIALKFYFAHEE